MKAIVLCLFMLISIEPTFGQGTYPLAKGNLWQYWDHDYQNGQWFWIYGWTETVICDTLMPNGKTYAIISSDREGVGAVKQYLLRQDGPKVILGYNQSNPDSDYVLYDFSKTVGDTMRLVVYPSGGDTELTTIAADAIGDFFGLQHRYQDYLTRDLHTSYYWIDRVTDGFGLVYQEGEAGTTWYLRGAIIDNERYGTIVSVEHQQAIVATNFQLEQNYPNPFNSSTTIRLTLQKHEHAFLVIYNILGMEVRHLLNAKLDQGPHDVKWDGKDSFGRSVPSGTYIYRATVDGATRAKVMTLTK